jgi:LacI family transcriptional regulator
MKTTLKMVAEHAGVSRGTVDRVLNKRGKVKPEVEQRVLESMRILNYTPNTAARALAFTKNAKKIGFLMPNQPGFLMDEITRAIDKIIEESKDLGIDVLVEKCDLNNPNEYIEKIDEMLAEGVCGFAIRAQNTISIVEKIDELNSKEIPVITVNSDIPTSKRRCFVGENPTQSGRVAGEIMSKYLGKEEKILVIAGIPEFDAHINRVKGFQNFLKEKGISEESSEVIYTQGNYELTYKKVFENITKYSEITKIYMAIDSEVACAEAIQRAGLQHKIFMISHDTPPSTIELLKKGVIDFTIEQDIYTQGYKSLQLLKDYILSGKQIENIQERMVIHILSAECI